MRPTFCISSAKLNLVPAQHTAGFQRVVQRAAHYADGRGRPNRTGAELLVAIFAETDSPAARLLGEQA